VTADLVAFLRARLDEREQAAHVAIFCTENGPDITAWFVGNQEVVGPAGESIARAVMQHPGILDLIATNDPAFVLADVAAKRAILDQAEDWIRYEPPARERHLHDVAAEAELGDAGRQMIRLLVQPYAGHPEFHPAWAVTT